MKFLQRAEHPLYLDEPVSILGMDLKVDAPMSNDLGHCGLAPSIDPGDVDMINHIAEVLH